MNTLTNDQLLDELDKERNKFSSKDDTKYLSLIDELVKNKVYPQPPKMTVKQMVDGWGARWHEYRGKLNCPHCQADLRDLKNGAPFKRELGCEVLGIYDGVLYYQCPDCKKSWARKGFEDEFAKLGIE